MEILTIISPYLIPFIGTVVSLLLVAGARKLFGKWGIERSDKIDAMLDKYVDIGVNYAEVAARNYFTDKGEKMSGESKMSKAVGVVMKELKQSGISDVAEELAVARIESWLEGSGHKPGISSDPQDGESD